MASNKNKKSKFLEKDDTKKSMCKFIAIMVIIGIVLSAGYIAIANVRSDKAKLKGKWDLDVEETPGLSSDLGSEATLKIKDNNKAVLSGGMLGMTSVTNYEYNINENNNTITFKETESDYLNQENTYIYEYSFSLDCSKLTLKMDSSTSSFDDEGEKEVYNSKGFISSNWWIMIVVGVIVMSILRVALYIKREADLFSGSESEQMYENSNGYMQENTPEGSGSSEKENVENKEY